MPTHITKEELKTKVKSDPSIVRKVTVNHGYRVTVAIEGVNTTFYWCSLAPTNMPKGMSEAKELKNHLVKNKCTFLWFDRKTQNEGTRYYYENGEVVKTKVYGSAVPAVDVQKVSLDNAAQAKVVPIQPESPSGKEWEFAGLSLPVRQTSSTPESLQSWIPKEDNGYVHTKDTTRRIMSCLIRQKAVMLKGHTGTGKTELLRNLAFNCNAPFLIIPCSADMETSNLLGYNTVDDDGSICFVEGLLTTAVRHGAWVYFDEFNAMSADITTALNPLLDGSRCLVLTEDRGRKVPMHPDFRFLASGNPATHAGYRGTQVQNLSLINRMTTIMIDYLDPTDERKVLINQFKSVPQTYIERLIKVANKIRKLFKQSDIQSVMTTRDLIDILSDMVILKDAFNGNWDNGIDDALASWVGKVDYLEDANTIYGICEAEMEKGVHLMKAEVKKIIS